MSLEDDPAITLEAKLHAFVQSLTSDEMVVFDDVLTAWSEAGSTLDDVEGFTAHQRDLGKYNRMMEMLSKVSVPRNLTQGTPG